MNFLPCLGGSNHSHYWREGMTWCRPFVVDARGQTLRSFEVETYLLDQHPELNSYWRHESLTTPEAIEAALVAYRARVRQATETGWAANFAEARQERLFRERQDKLNLAAAQRLMAVLRGERRSNQWRPMDRRGWHYLLLTLNGYPQRDKRNRLDRADTINIDGARVVVWFDIRAFNRERESAQADHGVLIIHTRGREEHWWGNEPAALDLLEPA